MDIDFPLVLVVLTFATGLIWLADKLFLRERRMAAYRASGGTAVDAGEGAESEEPREPYLVDLSRSFFPVLAIVLVLRSFLVEPFQIPSGSMLPTLEVGDFILVNKYAYGLRLPVVGTKVVEVGDPQRGDVMVFKFPEDGETNYIKRVIGLPGDRIRYRDKKLYINGELVETRFIARLPPVELRREDLGRVEHDIFLTLGQPGGSGEGEWVVPENHYFVMGDNRDNSNDSRYWGTVPDEMVVGKAFAIWMHWKSLTSLPSFDRVGGIE
ncbi:signal peptidase I [Marinobacter gudaonensis]|uniref:Signal peptidase I n=1 Tax=Marinobacter gudaonensis TaxID=375760 RepID=A0A1I6HMP7_9GAMM|nr:signal peptidase I [Marinobacter gudaonensis]SFR55694.1 signal peptidase I [Marinobacter gudaonensis]